jgi:protein-tyrosine phosphatase
MLRDRVVDLAGSCNFRDFGDYATCDGRRVRRGRLYRSGVLNRLTPTAVEQVRRLHVRAVCDLRRTEERQLHPNPDFGATVRSYQWDTQVEVSPIRDRRFIESTTASAAHAAMLAMYQRMPFVLQPRLAGMYAAAGQLAGDAALVVHCSAGKDRTGLAAALLLATLGVPRATILEDYALTETVVDLRAHLLGAGSSGAGLAATATPLLALPAHALDAVLAAHPAYIAASFAAIEERCGSVERYVTDELGVTQAALQHLRQAFLD